MEYLIAWVVMVVVGMLISVHQRNEVTQKPAWSRDEFAGHVKVKTGLFKSEWVKVK